MDEESIRRLNELHIPYKEDMEWFKKNKAKAKQIKDKMEASD